MPKGSGRPEVSANHVDNAIQMLRDKLVERLQEKGRGTFKSSHEILGIIEEEVYEVKLAVHQNNPVEVEKELLDLAVGAIFGIACIENDEMDWL